MRASSTTAANGWLRSSSFLGRKLAPAGTTIFLALIAGAFSPCRADDEATQHPLIVKGGGNAAKPVLRSSPDGKWTVQVDPKRDSVARLIETATNKPTGAPLTHADSGRTARRTILWAFSPDGKYLATAFSADTIGGGDTAGDIHVWKIPECRAVDGRHWSVTGYVRNLQFSDDSRFLFFRADQQSGK